MFTPDLEMLEKSLSQFMPWCTIVFGINYIATTHVITHCRC